MSKYVYISGPVTGTNDYPLRFKDGCEEVRKMGYEPINPISAAIHFPKTMDWSGYMMIALEQLRNADAIYMLPGWKNSNGARCEYYFAKGMGKEILNED